MSLPLLGAGPSSPVNFSPADLSAVKYWVDAGTISGVADGATIATSNLVDRSASNRGALASLLNVTYRANAGNGKPAVEFNGTDSYARSPSFTITQPHYVFIVLKQITWAGGKRYYDGNTVNRSLMQTSGITPQFGIYAGTATLPLEKSTDLGYVSMAEAFYNGASSTIRSNGNTTVTGNPGTLGFNDGMIFGAAGGLNAGFFANYQMLECIVADSTLTAGGRASIRAYLTSKHALITRSRLCCHGNSLTRGYPDSDARSADYPAALLASLGGAAYWKYSNDGADGRTTPQMISDGAAIDATLGTFAKTVLIGWEGTNDIGINGASAATAYNNLVTYYQARQAALWSKVYGMTILPRADVSWTGGMETIRQTINANLLTNQATFCNAVIDVAADARLSNPLNLTYYMPDKIHLTDAGYAVVAALAKPYVELP